MKVGYIRVSTEKQNLDRQLKQMEKEQIEKLFQEKVSGKSIERPEFQKMLQFARQGDTTALFHRHTFRNGEVKAKKSTA